MKAIISIIVILVIVGGGYLLMSRDNTPLAPTENLPATQTQNEVATTTIPSVKEFTITTKNFTFSPSTMRVSRGDIVRITLQNQGGTHDLVLDAFNARTKVLQNGQSETIEFTASSTGSFEYYCSVGTHRQMGMTGTLTVE